MAPILEERESITLSKDREKRTSEFDTNITQMKDKVHLAEGKLELMRTEFEEKFRIIKRQS